MEMNMPKRWSDGVVPSVLAVLAMAGCAVLDGGGPTASELLADRLQPLLAYQEDGHHLLLPPGERNLRRTVEAATALDLIDALDETHLAQTLDEIESSWSPAPEAYLTDDGPDEYGNDDESRESYHVDMLELNVTVTQFLEQTRSRPSTRPLPLPNLGRLVDQLGTDSGPRAQILRGRAAQLSGAVDGSGPTERCEQIDEHVRADEIDLAADIVRSLPSAQDCTAYVEPLSGHLAALETRIASRIAEERWSSVDDIVALDDLTTLSEIAGRTGPPAATARTAQMILRGLDEEARDYGPVTQTWVVAVVGGLLGAEQAPPLPHLTRRLNTLIDFRGSLATSASADWYSRTLMAHLMVLSGALAADQAAELFDHPSTDHAQAGELDWALAFVGLRSRTTADLALPSSVLAAGDDPEPVNLLIGAFYAADSGSCAATPGPERFVAVSPVSRVPALPPDQRLSYVLALTLSASCSSDMGELLAGLADQVMLPDEPPDPAVRGSLSFYLMEAEAACLVQGSVSLDPTLESRLDSYLRSISRGPVTQTFDFLDIYAALRLLSLHKQGSCAGAWWEGLR